MIKKGSNKVIVIVLIALLLAAIGAALYFLIQYNQTKILLKQKLTSPTSQVTQDKQKLLKDLGQLIELPNEDPSIIATVTDKSKLQNPFFTNAALGDRFIVFVKAQKAILYRPSTHKIIEVGPVSMTKESTTPTISPSPTLETVKLNLVVYNGTKIANLATKEKNFVLANMNNINVVSTGNSKKDYTENVVIDLKGGNNATAQQLAKIVSGKVVTMPSGEITPSAADLLLIVGKQ